MQIKILVLIRKPESEIIKLFSCSIEHEFYHAHKTEMLKNKDFCCFKHRLCIIPNKC